MNTVKLSLHCRLTCRLVPVSCRVKQFENLGFWNLFENRYRKIFLNFTPKNEILAKITQNGYLRYFKPFLASVLGSTSNSLQQAYIKIWYILSRGSYFYAISIAKYIGKKYSRNKIINENDIPPWYLNMSQRDMLFVEVHMIQ